MTAGTVLIFPPHWLPYQPYLSLPVLAGYLKANGHQSVRVVDANVLAMDWMLAPTFLGECRNRVRSRPAMRAASAPLLATSDDLVADIDDAKAVLRDPERFYDPPCHHRAMRILKAGYRLISAAWSPLEISFNDCKCPYSGASTRGILSALGDPESDFFSRFFSECIVPDVRASSPGLVGISIMCEDQVIPAFRLASLLRRSIPGVRLVAGGAVPTALVPELRKSPGLFDVFDWFVTNDGEDALLGIVRALEAGEEPEGVPNVLFRRDGVVRVGPIQLNAAERIATPHYGDLPFDRYLAPEFIAHLHTSRGCYYNRCKFCSHVATNVTERYRPMRVEHVIRDVVALKDTLGARYFNFWDEAIPPAMIRRLSEAILERGLDIRWNCLARFEDVLTPDLCRLAARAGCLEMSFGLESAAPRVLAAMDKGTDIEVNERVLANCTAAGIRTNLYAMVGYPSETLEEARETLDFVLRNRERITHCIFSVFTLMKNSPIMCELEAHGIEVIEAPEQDLRIRYPFRVLRPGSLDQAAAARLSEEFTRHLETSGLASANSRAGAHFLLFLARGVDPDRGTDLDPRTLSDDMVLARSPSARILEDDDQGDGGWAFDRSSWRMFRLSPGVLPIFAQVDGSMNLGALSDRLSGPAIEGAPDRRRAYRDCLARLVEQGLVAVADPVAGTRDEA